MTPDSATQELLDRVARIEPVLAAHSDGGDRDRILDPAVYGAMRAEGLFSLLAPKALGGLEVAPTSAYAVWEAVGRIDSAAGWNLAQASGGVMMSARLGAQALQRLWGEGGQPTFSGAGNPACVGKRTEGGYLVSGRVPFVSGCHHADWLFFVVMATVDGEPELDPASGARKVLIGFFPRTSVEILDTWNTYGMRGTGSADVVLNDAFVPDELAVPPAGPFEPQPAFTGPLYRLAPWLTIQGEAVGSIAIAAAAVELLPTIAEAKTSGASSTLLRDREYVQMNLGRAKALVDAARAYLYDTINDAYAQAQKGQSPSLETRLALQLAACNAAEGCAKAVDLVYEAAGSASIRTEGRMQRHFRDAHVLTQHATKSAPRYVSAGRVLLGLASDSPMLGGRPSKSK